MSMKIVPVYIENSKLLGNCQINTRGVTYIEKHQELIFVPWFTEEGVLSSIRVLKEEKGEICDECHGPLGEGYHYAGNVDTKVGTRQQRICASCMEDRGGNAWNLKAAVAAGRVVWILPGEQSSLNRTSGRQKDIGFFMNPASCVGLTPRRIKARLPSSPMDGAGSTRVYHA